MKRILILSISFLFSAQLEVEGNLKVNGNIDAQNNPLTNIEFTISNESYVEVKIYDINGNQVAVLAKSIFSPGINSIEWDASNFSSGVYIIKIISGEFVDSKKLILAK